MQYSFNSNMSLNIFLLKMFDGVGSMYVPAELEEFLTSLDSDDSSEYSK